jgi:hypothetical protein
MAIFSPILVVYKTGVANKVVNLLGNKEIVD